MTNKYLKNALTSIDESIDNLKKYINFFDDSDLKNIIIQLYDFKNTIEYLNMGVKVKKHLLDLNDLFNNNTEE